MPSQLLIQTILLVTLLVPISLLAAINCPQPVATISSSLGKVEVQPFKSANWYKANTTDQLCVGDMLKTAKSGKVEIKFLSGGGLTLYPSSTITIISQNLKQKSYNPDKLLLNQQLTT